jgi:AcrR family transcriptional regulator
LADRPPDPQRLLALLWRRHTPLAGRPTGPGRPPRLSVDDLVSGAVAAADADGLDGVTMARVARDLGVGTMTLYSYVRSKSELVELMVDEAIGELALPGPGEPRPESWRAQVELYADRTLAVYRRHPWLLKVPATRPPAGPGVLAEQEYVLSTLAGLDLDADRLNLAALAVGTFVRASVALEVEDAELERTSGQSGDAWWTERGSMWDDWFDVDRHPTMTAVWNAGGFTRGTTEQATESHRYGLHRLLDGIAGTP